MTTTISNGWVIAFGRTEEEDSRIAWRTPLCPLGTVGGVSLNQGWGTAFVRVGDRRFILDSATGRTISIRAGEVWRGPFYPMRPAHEGVTPPTYGSGGTPAPAAAAATAAGPYADLPGMAKVREANSRLLAALGNLEQVARFRQDGTATAADVTNAARTVTMARRLLRDAQREALREIHRVEAGQTAVPARPLAPPPGGAVLGPTGVTIPADSDPLQQAEAHVTQLLLDYNKAVATHQDLLAKDKSGLASAEQLATAEQTVRALSGELTRADQMLDSLRRTQSAVVAVQDLNIKDRTAILEAEHRVTRLTDKHDEAMKAWLRAVQDYQTDETAALKVQDAEKDLAAAVKELSAATRELNALREAANKDVLSRIAK